MRPLLPPCSRTSKPLLHKSQVPDGAGDKVLYDDPPNIFGLYVMELASCRPSGAENCELVSTVLGGKFLYPSICIVFPCQTENVIRYSNRVYLHSLPFVISNLVTRTLAIFLA
jgi:hypothetical protein